MSASKIALVTGSTSGIGREVARGLLSAGYEVIAHGRNADKAKAEAAALTASTGSDRIHTVLADLAKKSDVARMADDILVRFPKIDLIVHNAAVVPKTRVETSDGLDQCFASNVLAPFILTRRLDAPLRAGAPSRVLYFWGGGQNNFDIEDMQSRKTPYDGWGSYCQSKNACALLAQETARRLAGSGISVFGVLPGLVNTEGMQGLNNLFSKLGRPFFRTPKQGARTPLWVATEAGLESRSGTCFGSLLGSGWRNEAGLVSNAKDPALAAKLYALCEQLAGT